MAPLDGFFCKAWGRTVIPVPPPPIPPNFVADVQTPGLAFLAQYPHPTSLQWRQGGYWRAVHPHLYEAMNGVCVYSASFTPRRRQPNGIDHTTIDHYVPKSTGNHHQAYAWDNFRLCRERLNNRKSACRDVLDPYKISARLFQLDFMSFQIVADGTLSVLKKAEVEQTLIRLELNSDDAYVNERARVVYAYADARLQFSDLSIRYPFIGAEMRAQSFDTAYLPIFKRALLLPQVRQALLRQGVI